MENPYMFRAALFSLAFLTFYLTPAFASMVNYEIDLPNSSLTFEVNSTLHKVHGKAKPQQSEFRFDASSGEVELPVEIDVPVRLMDTQNKDRDTKMRKMFDADQYPVIQWRAKSVECEPVPGDQALGCEVEGWLKIRDIERPSSFQVNLKFTEDSIEVEGGWGFEREDFELETPTVMGFIRVDQHIDIEFKTHWIKKDS